MSRARSADTFAAPAWMRNPATMPSTWDTRFSGSTRPPRSRMARISMSPETVTWLVIPITWGWPLIMLPVAYWRPAITRSSAKASSSSLIVVPLVDHGGLLLEEHGVVGAVRVALRALLGEELGRAPSPVAPPQRGRAQQRRGSRHGRTLRRRRGLTIGAPGTPGLRPGLPGGPGRLGVPVRVVRHELDLRDHDLQARAADAAPVAPRGVPRAVVRLSRHEAGVPLAGAALAPPVPRGLADLLHPRLAGRVPRRPHGLQVRQVPPLRVARGRPARHVLDELLDARPAEPGTVPSGPTGPGHPGHRSARLALAAP